MRSFVVDDYIMDRCEVIKFISKHGSKLIAELLNREFRKEGDIAKMEGKGYSITLPLGYHLFFNVIDNNSIIKDSYACAGVTTFDLTVRFILAVGLMDNYYKECATSITYHDFNIKETFDGKVRENISFVSAEDFDCVIDNLRADSNDMLESRCKQLQGDDKYVDGYAKEVLQKYCSV